MSRSTHHLGLLLMCGCLAMSGLLQADPISGNTNRQALNHIVAWVPKQQALTSGVAQAQVHLHLDRALRAAEAELCNGTWQLSPARPFKTHPVAVTAPASLGAGPAWHYRLSQASVALDACPGVDAYAFQRSVSRHLPAWILIQPAYQLALLQQGESIAPDSILPTPTRVAGL
jgi:hypothetical protein